MAKAPARVLALLLLAAPSAALAGQFEDEVLAELNYARAHPARYAEELQAGGLWSLDDADPAAVREAIGFLRAQPPLPPLRAHGGLAAAAQDHAAAQGRRGGEGHGRAADGLGQRLQRQGVYAGLSAENISYGYDNPRDVVAQLVVDARVPSRGHRKTIFGRGFQVAGVACSRHPTYGAVCVIDFAGAIVQR